jgi:HAMP domain-containing protein
MSIPAAVRRSLSAQVALKLAVVVVVLTAVAATLITRRETRQMEDLTLEKARIAAAIGARQYGDVLDGLVDNGVVTVSQVFDRTYQPIRGFEFGERPKFHTAYDVLLDRAVVVFQDKFLDYEDFVFAVGVDVNGYLPTHNTRYQLPLTGDPARDLAGNRTKRMFDDPVGIAAARSVEPSLLQVYERDTGERMWDVSSPVHVKGKHWGAFRVGVSMERVDARERALLVTLAGYFALFGLVTLGTMFLVVKRAMRPVLDLSARAEQISMGEGLDTPIRTDAIDEIGQLTKTLDRLRVSMKAAMSRLGH